MLTAPKYANMKFAGFSQLTFTDRNACSHANGWYATVSFWIFKKRIFVCSGCGEVTDKIGANT